MANTSNYDFESTWNAYPSLLTTLSSLEHRQALERAVCASLCGRHAEADHIFEYDLPDASSSTLLLLVRSDMLTHSSREGERNDLLRLYQSKQPNRDKTAVSLLLDLMLADSDWWVFGKMAACLKPIRALKEHLNTISLHELTDIEIRCITLYYDVTNNLMSSSNELVDKDMTCWKKHGGNRYAETKAIRESLQGQARWRFAPTLMQLELKNMRAQQQSMESLRSARDMVAHLATLTNIPLRYRAVVLAGQLLPRLSPQLAADLRQRRINYLESITPSQYESWEQYCPEMSSHSNEDSTLKSDLSPTDKYNSMKLLITASIAARNCTRANQMYISTRNMLHGALLAGHKDRKAILQSFEENSLAYIWFHREHTRLVYFEAAALADHLSSNVIYRSTEAGTLQSIQDFNLRHTELEIPILLERLYDRARTAARSLGNKAALNIYNSRYASALDGCPFTRRETAGLTDEAVMDSNYAHRLIAKDVNDSVLVGINALQLMLTWSIYEVQHDLLALHDVEKIFGVQIVLLPNTSPSMIVSELSKRKVFEQIFKQMCGSKEKLTPTSDFLRALRRLQDWTLLSERLPGRSSRLFALRCFIQARIYLYREYLINQKGRAGHQHIEDTLRELEALKEVVMLEKLENNTTVDNDTTNSDAMNVRMVLMRCMVPPHRLSNSITSSELDEAMESCVRRIDDSRAVSNLLWEYSDRIRLIQLIWAKTLRFGPASLEETYTETLIAEAEKADELQRQIRRALNSPTPSRRLAAEIKTTDSFRRSEHFLYVFAALQRRMYIIKKLKNAEHLDDEYQGLIDRLADWSIRSKGQGMATLLQDDRVARRMNEDLDMSTSRPEPSDLLEMMGKMTSLEIVSSEQSDLHHLSQSSPAGKAESSLTLPVKENAISKLVSHEMVQSIVDASEDVIVVIDIVNIIRGVKGRFAALVYRKHRSISFVELEVGSQEVEEWLQENMRPPKKDQPVKTTGNDERSENKNDRDPQQGQADKLYEQRREQDEKEFKPLNTPDWQRRLNKLRGLIEPLFESETKEVLIPDGSTLVWCLTGALHTVPIHAIPIKNRPLIVYHPMVYVQSLTLMHNLWTRMTGPVSHVDGHGKHSILNPLPAAEYESVQSAKTISKLLNDTKILTGMEISQEQALQLLNESSVFNYQGHVQPDVLNSLDSYMELAGQEQLTVMDMIDKVKLVFPALCTILACASGLIQRASTDDVLGIPTALHLGGASSIVSTLWHIDDSDGAKLGITFYEKLIDACKESLSEASAEQKSTASKRSKITINLARVLQSAITSTYPALETNEDQRPYHWASFFLQGMWLYPAGIICGKGE